MSALLGGEIANLPVKIKLQVDPKLARNHRREGYMAPPSGRLKTPRVSEQFFRLNNNNTIIEEAPPPRFPSLLLDSIFAQQKRLTILFTQILIIYILVRPTTLT